VARCWCSTNSLEGQSEYNAAKVKVNQLTRTEIIKYASIFEASSSINIGLRPYLDSPNLSLVLTQQSTSSEFTNQSAVFVRRLSMSKTYWSQNISLEMTTLLLLLYFREEYNYLNLKILFA
jgi:hypothetical protein